MKSLAVRVPLAAVLASFGATAAVVVADPAGSATDQLCERHPDHRRCALPTTAVTTSTITTTTTTTTTPSGFLFADEFNGPGLDTSKWWAVPWCENDNNESYNCKNANNVIFPGDGTVHLRASVGTMGRPTDGAEINTFIGYGWPPSGGTLWKASPPVHIEARIKYAPGAGTWGAFWPMGAATSTPWEIDVSEVRGKYPTWAECHFHEWSTATGLGYDGRATTTFDTTAGFHTYWLDHTGTTATMGVDDVTCLTVPVVNQEVLLRLTNRIGTPGTWGGEGGPPANLPTDMLVDYVRVTAL